MWPFKNKPAPTSPIEEFRATVRCYEPRSGDWRGSCEAIVPQRRTITMEGASSWNGQCPECKSWYEDDRCYYNPWGRGVEPQSTGKGIWGTKDGGPPSLGRMLWPK